MNNISKLEFISELSTISIQSNCGHGICLFLGAGADVSSGGVLFSDLKRESVSFVRNYKIHDYESSENIDREFDNIIESLDEQARCTVIQRLIKSSDRWLPSDGYKLLILLAKENCISSVITTNFSNLLETTQDLMGVDAFQIFTPATAVPAQYFMRLKHQKAIYLKMHGDIDGKLVTHLTSGEIKNRNYQDEFVKLFEYLIQNETIVFLGYSGWDTKIAELFQSNLSVINSVYWCNISEPNENAPLIKIFRQNNINIKYINYNFDKALQVIATEFFKDRTLFHADSIFIWALVKSKIQKLKTEFLNNIKSESQGLIPVLRSKVTIFDDFILNTNKNFCIITGNSGIGKSMLMAQFCNEFDENEQIWIVPLNAMTTYSNDLLDYIVKKLGYASKDPYTVLYQFSRWACEQDKSFVFVIDNLGNRIGTIKEIASLLNKLIELSYVIRNYSHIKFIITLRTDIWNNIYYLLDTNYLNTIIWNDDKNKTNYAVRLVDFDEYELQRAKANILSVTKSSYISNDMLVLIKEPSLYGLIQKNAYMLENIDELNIYSIFEKTFFRGMSKNILEKLAYSILCHYVDAYMPSKLSKEAIIYLQNNHILTNIISIEEDKIEFKNHMVLECCLASYFTTTHYIDIFLQYNTSFEQDYLKNRIPSPLYYGIVRYLSINCNDFGKVVKLVSIMLHQTSITSKYVTKFVNDLFRYMALYDAEHYSDNIRNFSTHYNEFIQLLPFFIHSIGFMKDSYSFPLLAYLRDANLSSHTLECNALINDRFSIGIRESNDSQRCIEFFNSYIEYVLIPNKPLISLFTLLWIMGRIGRDNIYKDIYHTVATLVLDKIRALPSEFSKTEINEVKNSFIRNAYFIFFSADTNLEEKYYLYPSRSKTIHIFKQISNQKDLTLENISTICSLVNHFDAIEFFVCNMLFTYMAVCDFDYALRNLDMLYNTFNENTTVLELDFYSSALFLSCYVHDPLGREPYVSRYNKMVKDFEIKMFISPSMDRLSSCRKFEDKFEIEFEDGFNNFTAYTHTAPMNKYIQGVYPNTIDSYLIIIWELLDKLEHNGMYDEMLRLVQAINQMSVNWPEEALEALSKFSRYNHPIIRKAIIRTLKENYLRYPNITTRFLNQTGEAFSEDELLEIYSATNSQIENRTLEQLQWARIIYFIKTYLNFNIMEDIFGIFNSSDTLYDVFDLLAKCLVIKK